MGKLRTEGEAKGRHRVLRDTKEGPLTQEVVGTLESFPEEDNM